MDLNCYPVDIVCEPYNGADSPRLPVDTIAELNSQLNVNLTDTDSGSDGDSEAWFNEDTLPVGVNIVDETEFFNRFCS